MRNVRISCNQSLFGFKDSARLQRDLINVEQLEDKITNELKNLKARISRMTTEIRVFSDLDKLEKEEEERRIVSV